jgi:protoheme IX farnesyltransferase
MLSQPSAANVSCAPSVCRMTAPSAPRICAGAIPPGRSRRSAIVQRPLVRGLTTPGLALGWSILLCVSGLAWLATAFNAATAFVGVAIIVIYGFIYTPMKRTTHWATEVGSVSGALPPLLGSAAAGEFWSVPAWVLAAVLFFWQMPHFFAIGWVHRGDYRAAGLPLLPATDETGQRTSAWSFGYSIALAAALILPWPMKWMGAIFGVTASCIAAVLVVMAWRFLNAPGNREHEARRLFRTTLFTLPLLLLAMIFDRG